MTKEELNTDPGFFDPTSLIQLSYGLWVALVTVGVGLAFGFSAVAIPQLKREDSPINVTRSDEAWIASVVTLASPVGCLVGGYLLDQIGRKLVLQLCLLPMVIGWFILALSESAITMIIARVIMGVGCGMSTVPPRIYMSEFTLPNMRGVVGAIPNFSVALGVTLQALMGTFCSWVIISWIGVAYSTALFFANFALPESPYYLLLKGNIEGAKKSLTRFRSKSYNVQEEMEELIAYREDNHIRRLTTKELFPALFRASSCKPFAIINTYVLFTQLAGVTVVTFWTIDILVAAKSSLDPSVGNVCMALVRMLAGVLCSVLLFRCKRKTLSYISGTGAGLCFIAMGLCAKFLLEKHIAPMLCALMYMGFASIGYYTIPLMLMGEMYPLQIRGILGGLTISITFLLIFCANNLYPFLKAYWGFSTVIIVYGTMALCGVLYVYFFLPETKDMSLSEIEEYFNGFVSTPLSHKQLMSMQLVKSKQSDTGMASTSKVKTSK